MRTPPRPWLATASQVERERQRAASPRKRHGRLGRPGRQAPATGPSSPGLQETERVRRLYDAMAPRYDRVIAVAERLLFDDGRRWACSQASGHVLEVAIGTGRNLPYYPPGVSVTGIDLSPGMLREAESRAAQHETAVELQVGDAQHLPYPDDTFDTVLATLTLCSIPDDRAAVAEMARVLRPGGLLILLDHIASPNRLVRAAQQVLDPLAVRLHGDHLLRDPAAAVVDNHLRITEYSLRRCGIVLRLTARNDTHPTRH